MRSKSIGYDVQRNAEAGKELFDLPVKGGERITRNGDYWLAIHVHRANRGLRSERMRGRHTDNDRLLMQDI